MAHPVLLLHGAIGAAAQMEPLAGMLGGNSITLDFSGHGGRPFSAKPFSISAFADEALALLDDRGIQQVDIFGYSMGGYAGMYLAKLHPERINTIVTLATKFHWDEPTAAKEMQMLDAGKIEAKVPAFAKALQERHVPNDWKEVMQRTAAMLKALGEDNLLKPEDYESIQVPTLIMLGDRDRMVTLEETVAVYRALPNAQLAIVPGTHHPIEQVNLDALAFLVKQFLDN
jgi:pimeloyl-ACP methyl ester carboxylesterase